MIRIGKSEKRYWDLQDRVALTSMSRLDQVLKRASAKQTYFVPGEHDICG
jgi:hypothetical protein